MFLVNCVSALFNVQKKMVRTGKQGSSKNRMMGVGRGGGGGGRGGMRGIWNHGVIGRDFNYVENQYILQGPGIMNCNNCIVPQG